MIVLERCADSVSKRSQEGRGEEGETAIDISPLARPEETSSRVAGKEWQTDGVSRRTEEEGRSPGLIAGSSRELYVVIGNSLG